MEPANATSNTGAMRDQRHDGEHDPTAVPVGQRADRNTPDRAHQDRRGHQQRSLTARQRHCLGIGRGQRPDEVPGPEVDRERPGRQGEVDALPGHLHGLRRDWTGRSMVGHQGALLEGAAPESARLESATPESARLESARLESAMAELMRQTRRRSGSDTAEPLLNAEMILRSNRTYEGWPRP